MRKEGMRERILGRSLSVKWAISTNTHTHTHHTCISELEVFEMSLLRGKLIHNDNSRGENKTEPVYSIYA